MPGSTNHTAAPEPSTRYLPGGPPSADVLCQTRYRALSDTACGPLRLSKVAREATFGALRPGETCAAGTYTVAVPFRPSRIGPSSRALAAVPIRIAICCFPGVAPTR